jgi:LPXTG-motif cell wall-anchored protein
VTSGGVLATMAALEVSDAMAESSGPTGIGAGADGPTLPQTGSSTGAVLTAAAVLAAGGAAAMIARGSANDKPNASA